MDNFHKPKDEDLLLYIFNELEADQRQKVKEWIHSNDQNKKYFSEFYLGHVDLICASNTKFIKNNYKLFKKKIVPSKPILKYISVAASICLLIVMGLWLQKTSQEVQNPLLEGRIIPGQTKAVLFLSDTDSISIDHSSQNILKQQGITIDAQGNIRYANFSPDKGKPTVYHKLVVPRGGEFQLNLEDGTKVWLNSESELIYPIKFSAKSRLVKMKGEAYFEVTKNQMVPFIVEVENMMVKVYGTAFNINQHKAGVIETVLVNGRVGIVVDGKTNLMAPNEKAEYKIQENQLSISPVNVQPYIAWKEGRFYFDSENLETIMNNLARWYNLTVSYEQEELKQIILSGNLKRHERVEKLFHSFERIAPIHIIVENNHVKISKK